jgi:hypothetical protein
MPLWCFFSGCRLELDPLIPLSIVAGAHTKSREGEQVSQKPLSSQKFTFLEGHGDMKPENEVCSSRSYYAGHEQAVVQWHASPTRHNSWKVSYPFSRPDIRSSTRCHRMQLRETDVNDDIAMFRMLTFATNLGKSQVFISPDIYLL